MYNSSEQLFQLLKVSDSHCDLRRPTAAPELLRDCTQFVAMHAAQFSPLFCCDEGFRSVLFIPRALSTSVRLALRQTRSLNRF